MWILIATWWGVPDAVCEWPDIPVSLVIASGEKRRRLNKEIRNGKHVSLNLLNQNYLQFRLIIDGAN